MASSVIHQHILNTFQNETSTTPLTFTPKFHKANSNLDKLSSLGIKYPKLRDNILHTGHLWLESKRIDDGAEGLWRIHDKLYDFSTFVSSHPGGKDWLVLTKGTDITEAFESHHLSHLPESMLSQYYIKDATQPRNSPFTFNKNDFYRVLKQRIYEKLSNLPTTKTQAAKNRSKRLTDLLFLSYCGLAVTATYFRSFLFGTVSGVLLSLAAIASHNFFHQKDNFRMYYFDFTFMQSREWRISHALSHHLYTNTINDLEISTLEPFLQYLPIKKNFVSRYLSWLYSPVIYAFVYIGYYVRTVIQKLIIGEAFTFEFFLPFSIPMATWFITGQPLMWCIIMYAWIITVSSFYFGLVGVNAAHHHPDIFHDGDATRPKDEMDWGIHQLDAVADRKDITGSHFLVLTNFGDHALHHLFPTIDHGLLEYLYPVFLDTVEEFGLHWNLTSQFELVKGQYRQLAKTQPKLVPPPKAVRKQT